MPFESFNLSNSDYIPQFAGLPLDRVKEVGDQLQNRHYENIARLRQLELLGHQQKAGAESDLQRNYIDTQIGSIQSALGDIAKNGGENATSRVGALATQFLGDENLINIGKSIEARQREKQTIEKFGKQAVFSQKALDSYKQNGAYDEANGRFGVYEPTAQERLDYMKKQDAVVAPLEADITQSDLTGDIKTTLNALGANFTGDLATMPTQLKTTVIKALTSKKVQDYIDSKGGWEVYKDSAEFRQQADILGMSEEDIKNELKSRAEAKVFSAINKDWVSNRAFDWKAGQKTTEDPLVAGEQLSEEPIEYKDPLWGLDDFDVKKRGGVDIITGPSEKEMAPGRTASTVSTPEYTGINKNISSERWKQLNTFAQAGTEIFGEEDFKPVDSTSTPEEIKKAKEYAVKYSAKLKERQVFHIQDVSFTQREKEEGRSNAKDVSEDVQKNIRSRAIYDMTNHKLIQVIGNDATEYSKDFQEVIGVPENIEVTGSLDPQNYIAKSLNNPEFADAYMANIKDPRDTSKAIKVLITRKKYPEGKQKVATIKNRGVNEIYSTVNIEPGIEKEITIFGHRIKAQELVGNQLEKKIANWSEDQKEIARSYRMPIWATIPGESEPQLFDGPKYLADNLFRLALGK